MPPPDDSVPPSDDPAGPPAAERGVFEPRSKPPAGSADDDTGGVVIHGPGGTDGAWSDAYDADASTSSTADEWGDVVIHGPGGAGGVSYTEPLPPYDPDLATGAGGGSGTEIGGEPVVTWRPGGGTVTGTTGGAVPSGLGRDVVPGVAQSVDSVVWRATGAVAGTAVAAVVAWGLCGRDGVLDDGEVVFMAVAAGAAIAAVGFLVATIVGAVTALREIRRSGGHRFGRARVAFLTAAAVVAVTVGLGVTATHVSEARDAGTADAGQDNAAPGVTVTTVPPIDPITPISLVDLTHQPVGKCLRWPGGPTRADRLGDRADPSTIRLASCTESHNTEVVGELSFPGDGVAPYPSFSERREFMDLACLLKFLVYLTAEGAPPVGESSYVTYGIAPTQADWIRGERRGVCLAVPPDAVTTRTTTLRGAGG